MRKRVGPPNRLETVYHKWLVRIANVIFHKKVFCDFRILFCQICYLILDIRLLFEIVYTGHYAFFNFALIVLIWILGVFQAPLEKGHRVELPTLQDIVFQEVILHSMWHLCDLVEQKIRLLIFFLVCFDHHLTVDLIPVGHQDINFAVLCDQLIF